MRVGTSSVAAVVLVVAFLQPDCGPAGYYDIVNRSDQTVVVFAYRFAQWRLEPGEAVEGIFMDGLEVEPHRWEVRDQAGRLLSVFEVSWADVEPGDFRIEVP
ncbi:MAG: hypothetical protein O3A10_15060 [Chloroflexi bacterium]|nr:hypothetical protein [Chloroflexota bacterium]MDA1145776.1 hypothetical protein [Chloroflexota bacterium]